MKTSIRNLILAAVAGVALVSASLAMADGPGCSGSAPGHAGYRPAAMGHGAWAVGHGPMGMSHDDMASAQLDALRQSLQLTSQQEPAWSAFSAAAQAQVKRMTEFRDEMGTASQTMPERIERASKFAKERERAVEQVGMAVKDLYGVLTPDQRAQLDRRGPWTH